jgi:threonine dehydrogenase-like Zn-dependent dehydrogenase
MGQVVESTSTRVHQGDWVVALPDNDLGLAEFYLADETRAVVLPDGPGLGEACLVQPLATVLYAVDRLEPVASRSVAVVGLGSMGLLFCWLLRRRGAGRILGIDPRPDRCKVALRLGADQAEAVTSAEVVLAARQNPPAWNAPQVCIEAVGHQLETLNDCIDLVHDQGTVVAFGVPDQPVYPLAFETFFRKNAGLVACVTPPWDRYLGDALELFISSRRELEVLFTHRFPMRNAAEAFAAYERRDPGLIKVLLEAPQW